MMQGQLCSCVIVLFVPIMAAKQVKIVVGRKGSKKLIFIASAVTI
jgi:hypothetical protein